MGSILLAAVLLFGNGAAEASAAPTCARDGADCRTATDAAPVVSISPSGGTYTSAQLPVTISWASEAGLDAGTRQILLNGVDVTASFSYGGSASDLTPGT
ncbi:MAG TPA: hypothetical protein VF212_01550 [Longimicrobiales bacterium]